VTAALTDEQIEQLHIEYAQLGQVSKAARAVGVSWSSAKRYLKQELIDPTSELAITRERKKCDIAERMGQVIEAQLEALATPEKINKASYQELSTSLGILTDKRLLLTGQPTSRIENVTGDPAAKLTPDEMEAASRIRAKLAAEAS
jgi:hypothetical protein